MKIVTDFPHQVQEIENIWIPMSDGVRLAAHLWLPRTAEREPVPAIVEYIPYRKRDGTAHRDSIMHPYFAGHGYACVRVDLRGSGDSEGILTDEYLDQELDDGEEVLRWIADQSWCNGNVGMMGISWGGFNSLQIAARQAPQLKAIITACSTDDRYSDDIHYMGGCLLGDNLSWASTMFAYTASPPDPEIVGERWRDMWRQRLEGSGIWLEAWLRHQRRDGYWKHGSICEDYRAIRCPVYAVGGWADGYTDAIFRMLQHLEVPRRALVGPWGHKYPHEGLPGPAVGFLQDALRWWDQWLKGIDTGIMDEPMLHAWMQDSMPPLTHVNYRPGRWVGEPSWPSPNVQPSRYTLAVGYALVREDAQRVKDKSGPSSGNNRPLPLQSPLSVGLFAGKWVSETVAPDLPGDQREDDGGSLVFESDALEEPMEILGAPLVELDLTCNEPVAMLAVRLSDIAPDRKSTRVTYGLLNLTHRRSNETPERLEPGRRYTVQVKLNDVAQVFPAGHAIRLSLSTCYWPLAWPPPQPTRLMIHPGTSRLTLPIRQVVSAETELPPLPEPEGAPPIRRTVLQPGEYKWTIHRNLEHDESYLQVINDRGVLRFDAIDWEMQSRAEERYFFRGDDFTSVRGDTRWERSFRRGDWFVKIITRMTLTSSATHFRIQADLDAYESDQRVFCRSWDRVIARDHI